MLYTESFKKQVVKKALSPGVMQKDICRKLGVSGSALVGWKKRYAAEVQTEIQEIDVAALLAEEEVDIEDLLRRAERTDLAEESGSQVIAAHIDQLMNSGKNASEYDPADKYAVIRVVRPLERGKRSLLLRRLGLCERHINQWEEELIKMSKHSISNDEHLKALEGENKRLKKQLSESERGRHELEVLIELKNSTTSFSSRARTKSKRSLPAAGSRLVPRGPGKGVPPEHYLRCSWVKRERAAQTVTIALSA